MNSLVSVIVPVYKVEKYLEKCVSSIISQTYKNLEIILVDDGSPDNCPNMCDEFAKKDKRIKVIHKENGGLSDARNAGLDIMTGDFVCFVDSDDWVEKNYVEEMLNIQQKTNADVVACGINLVDEESGEVGIYYKLDKTTTFESSEIIEKYYNGNGIISGVAWNKLYKKQIFENLRYPKGIVFEDVAIILNILFQCKKVVILKDMLYNYLDRQGSIMKSNWNHQKLVSKLFMFGQRLDFLINNNLTKYLGLELVIRVNDVCWTYRELCDKKEKKWFKTEILKLWKKYKKHIKLTKKSLKTYLNIIYLRFF